MRTVDTQDRWGPWLAGADDRAERREAAAVIAPFDGRRLGEVELADGDDVAGAVAAATRAFAEHRKVPGHVRAGWLHDAADALDAGRDELTETLIATLGKPRKMSAIEAGRGVDLLRLCAEEIGRLHGENLPLDAVPGGEGRWGFTRREPFGVVVAVTPFNAPINLLLQKVAPALATGNAVIVKPAPEGAIVALQVAELLTASVPDGLVQVLNGGADVGQALVSHPAVRAVSLTGGVAAGEAVLRSAGVKPVMLELGSNAPNLVCADADVAQAASQIALAAFGASGQQCISAQRVIVERAVFEDFSEQFVAASAGLRVGDPSDETTQIGPLVSEARREHVLRFLTDAEERGAKVLLDGRSDDLMFGPTIVRDVPPDGLLMCDEVFGPVAVLVEADSLDHAIAVANDSELGLQAACFTSSLANAMRAAEELEAGSVWINEASRFRLDTYPFGGYKRSGVGREGVRYAMEALTQVKFVGLRGL